MYGDIEKLIWQVDEALAPDSLFVDGPAVRQLAGRRRRRSRVAAAVVAGLTIVTAVAALTSWPGGAPEVPVATDFDANRDGSRLEARKPPTASDGAAIARLPRELDRLAVEERRLRQEFEIGEARLGLARLSRRLAQNARFMETPDQIAARNTAAYAMLLVVTDSLEAPVTEAARSELERLIDQFPETTASQTATELLTIN